MVRPSREVFADMLSRVATLPSYDGGDQGFLNAYFADWFAAPAAQRLPFAFNVLQPLAHLYPPAWRELHARRGVRVLHFCGDPASKPWAAGARTVVPDLALYLHLWQVHSAIAQQPAQRATGARFSVDPAYEAAVLAETDAARVQTLFAAGPPSPLPTAARARAERRRARAEL